MAISRDRLDEYRAGIEKLSQMAQADIRAVYDAFFPLKDPELMRDAMEDAAVNVTGKYGDMAAALAAELFEEMGEAETGRAFDALLSDTYDPGKIVGSVRFASRKLFAGEWDNFISYLNGTIDKAVKQPARDTIMDNAARHADRGTRFARIPKGPTCPFCLMLASRGFVYRSEDKAGELTKFHPRCDCAVVPSWEKSPRVDGYDQSGMYDRYRVCRKTCGSGSTDAILAEMRTRDKRWLYDGTEPPVTFASEKLERETRRNRPHELRTAERLRRHGIAPDFQEDAIVVSDEEAGCDQKVGLADFLSGYEIKTLLGTASRNTVNGYLKSVGKKKGAVAVVFDNSENQKLSDGSLATMLLSLRSFSRGRVYLLGKDGSYFRIR